MLLLVNYSAPSKFIHTAPHRATSPHLSPHLTAPYLSSAQLSSALLTAHLTSFLQQRHSRPAICNSGRNTSHFGNSGRNTSQFRNSGRNASQVCISSKSTYFPLGGAPPLFFLKTARARCHLETAPIEHLSD